MECCSSSVTGPAALRVADFSYGLSLYVWVIMCRLRPSDTIWSLSCSFVKMNPLVSREEGGGVDLKNVWKGIIHSEHLFDFQAFPTPAAQGGLYLVLCKLERATGFPLLYMFLRLVQLFYYTRNYR